MRTIRDVGFTGRMHSTLTSIVRVYDILDVCRQRGSYPETAFENQSKRTVVARGRLASTGKVKYWQPSYP